MLPGVSKVEIETFTLGIYCQNIATENARVLGVDERQRLCVASLPVHYCHDQPPSRFSAPGHKAINPPTFYDAGQAMARYFAQA